MKLQGKNKWSYHSDGCSSLVQAMIVLIALKGKARQFIYIAFQTQQQLKKAEKLANEINKTFKKWQSSSIDLIEQFCTAEQLALWLSISNQLSAVCGVWPHRLLEVSGSDCCSYFCLFAQSLDELDDDDSVEKDRKQEEELTQQNTVQNEAMSSEHTPAHLAQVSQVFCEDKEEWGGLFSLRKDAESLNRAIVTAPSLEVHCDCDC